MINSVYGIMEIRVLTTDYMGSHCYIVIEKGHAIIIDPGDEEIVINALSDGDVMVDFCILTHEHCDHIFGCSGVREKFHCRMISSRTCDANIRNSRRNFSMYYNSFISVQNRLDSTAQKEMKPFATFADEVFEFEDKQTWMGHRVFLKETPGHSSGSICVLLDDFILFSGDTLLKDDYTGTKFIGGSKTSLLEKTIPWLNSLSKNTFVYPGHGDSFILGERLSRPIV